MPTVTPRVLHPVLGDPVPIPADTLVHLQFRRFAGCPICHLHLRQVVVRHAEITAAGISEVVVFHSTTAELAPYAPDLPFPLIADPTKHLYREFGVGTSRRALAPAAWPAIARGALPILAARQPAPPRTVTGGRLGLPADFLITPDGHLAATHHGAHADDQWTVDELLALAAEVSL
ncbi:peroxiredoxin-like family protein [Actinokineospora soli]|uniref:Peroxiredoxin-like family protein n=1 Tax=Actinokineospora soli TaxID=1048753 RepID=A0ABW2TNZ5_9PSEU